MPHGPRTVSQTIAAPIEAEVQPRTGAAAETKRDGAVISTDRRLDPAVHNFRHVLRHVNNLRISRENSDEILLGVHLLLRRALQRATRPGLNAKPLDRIHHVFLLIQERRTNCVRPVKLFIHHFQGIRKPRESLYAGVQPHLIELRQIG